MFALPQVEKLFALLFDDLAPGEWLELFKLPQGQDFGIPTFHETVAAVLMEASKWEPESRINLFFGVVPRLRPDGHKESVAYSSVLWADFDEPGMLSRALPPTALVSSGRGLHGYYKLSQRHSPEEIETANKLLQALGADVGTYNVDRRLRVPGTLNFKYLPDTYPVELREFQPELVYDLSDILGFFKTGETVWKRIVDGNLAGFRGKVYDSRSERDMSVIRALVRAGCQDDFLKTIFAYHSHGVGDKYAEHPDPAHYLTWSTENVRHKLTVTQAVTDAEFENREDGTYGPMNRQGIRSRVASFTFEPEYLVVPEPSSRDEAEESLYGRLRANDQIWEGVVLPRSAFGSTPKMNAQLTSAFWHWIGSDKEVRMYLPWLMDQLSERDMPTRSATVALGRHRTPDGDVWLGTSQTFGEDHEYLKGKEPLVYLPTTRETPTVTYPLRPDVDVVVQAAWKLLPFLNLPSVVWPVLGWHLATFQKTVLEARGIRFPDLCVFGEQGSGKTSLLQQVMQKLMGITGAIGAETIGTGYSSDLKPFPMKALLASGGVPVHLMEWRNTNRHAPLLLETLREKYDSGREVKGTANQSTKTYQLRAPVVLDGEDIPQDAAMLERLILVNPQPSTIRRGRPAWQAFQDITKLPLADISGQLVLYALANPPRVLHAEELVEEAFKGVSVPNRILRNFSVVVVGLLMYAEFGLMCDAAVPVVDAAFVRDVLTPSLGHAVRMESGRVLNLADDFVVAVTMHAFRQMAEGFYYRYLHVQNLLSVHLQSAYEWWASARKRAGLPSLSVDALRHQLEGRVILGDDSEDSLGRYIVAVGKNVSYKTATGNATMRSLLIDVGKAHQAGLEVPNHF